MPTSAPEYQDLIGPTQTALLAVIDVKEKNRAAKESNQLTVVSEGIPALGWVTLVRWHFALARRIRRSLLTPVFLARFRRTASRVRT